MSVSSSNTPGKYPDGTEHEYHVPYIVFGGPAVEQHFHARLMTQTEAAELRKFRTQQKTSKTSAWSGCSPGNDRLSFNDRPGEVSFKQVPIGDPTLIVLAEERVAKDNAQLNKLLLSKRDFGAAPPSTEDIKQVLHVLATHPVNQLVVHEKMPPTLACLNAAACLAARRWSSCSRKANLAASNREIAWVNVKMRFMFLICVQVIKAKSV